MKWEAVPKAVRSKFPFPVLTAYTLKNRYRRGFLNVLALALLPDAVVLLRNGDHLALRAAKEADGWEITRPVRHAPSQGIMVLPQDIPAGQRFRLVPDGDLILLEPFNEEKR